MARLVVPKCRECGEPIQQSPTGRRREFCSSACRSRAYRERRKPVMDRMPSFEPPVVVPVDRDYLAAAGWRAATDADLEAEGWPRQDGPELHSIDKLIPRRLTGQDEEVVQTLLAAIAVAGEFRQLGDVARGQFAARCAKVADVLTQALKEEFGDIAASG